MDLKKVVILFVFVLSRGRCDQTTCMSDYESSEGLHYICFCDPPNKDIWVAAKEMSKDHGFSLSDFAFHLAGSYFSKAIFITFQACRNLRVKLDQSELTRIGSDHLRPDIQIRGLTFEQIYHLELLRDGPKEIEEFVNVFPSDGLNIQLQSVAVVKVDAGATFASMTSATKHARLYIDLNEGRRGEEDGLNIKGFKAKNIFFITNKIKVPLQEGEDLGVKMRQLSSEMIAQTHELSFALTIFAVVVLVGIVGLAAVVAHRQRKKRRLRAILRAKSLGPILQSKEIAHGRNLQSELQRYTQVRKMSSASASPPTEERMNNPSKRMDINEFLSAMLYRTRKGQYKTGMTGESPPCQRSSSEAPETSFYYRESSLSEASVTEKPGVLEVEVHHQDNDDNGSYVSKISQQAFISVQAAEVVLPKSDLKEKFITFFSTVTKPSNSFDRTKL